MQKIVRVLAVVTLIFVFYSSGRILRRWSTPHVSSVPAPTTAAPTPETWLKTHALFAKSYRTSPDHHGQNLELENRLSQLQTLPKTDGPQSAAEWSFYKYILENSKEQWLVQRQALKNINGRLPAVTESDRSALLAKIDKRALATWMLSDLELAQHLLGTNDQ